MFANLSSVESLTKYETELIGLIFLLIYFSLIRFAVTLHEIISLWLQEYNFSLTLFAHLRQTSKAEVYENVHFSHQIGNVFERKLL